MHATIPTLLQAVVALASVLSRNRSKADVLEGAMALIEEAQSVDAEVLAEIMELHLRRGEYQAVSGCARHSPRLPLSVGFCRLLTRDTRVRSPALRWSQSRGSQWKRSCAATELAHLEAALDPKHDNLVHAVAQRDGPRMIRDLIDVCDALSKDSNVVGRQTTAERHASSIVREPAREGDLVSAVDFFKKLKMRGRAVSCCTNACSRHMLQVVL